MMVISDLQPERVVRTRIRASTSCTECKRRKQRCDQETPCNNCSTRPTPVTCTYESIRGPTNYESVVDLSTTDQLKHLDPSYLGRADADFLTAAQEQSGSGSGSRSPTSSDNLAILQVSSRRPSRGSLNPSPVSFENLELLGNGTSGYEGSYQDVSTAFSMGQYFPYAEAYQSPYYLSQEVPAGGVDLEPLMYLPIEYSKRNAQLFRFFTLRLSPYISSIDGSDPPSLFEDQYMPFLIQSPIAIHVTILTACYFQASIRGIHFDKAVEVIATKVKLITLINEHIASNKNGVSDDAIAAVMSLTNNELIYADEKSTLAHIQGLRDMIKTRGGISNIKFQILRMMLLRTDFQVACTYECDLFMHPSEPIPTLQLYPLILDSPLLLSPHSFTTSAYLHNTHPASAQILDDIRFLTTSVIQLSTSPHSEDAHANFFATAQWIRSRIITSDRTLSDDHVHRTIQTTALIYVTAILTRTPLSQSCTPRVLSKLWASLWSVPLPRWKQIPGIFFWVLLVANPYTRDKSEGRFLKGLMPATTVAIGIVDWDVLVGIMRAFLGVQRWLRGEKCFVIGSSRAVPGLPVGGIPDWSMTE